MQITVGIIKPESIKRNLTDIIIDRIKNAGLIIESTLSKKFSYEEFNLIYGNVNEPNWLHEARRKYLTSNKSIFLKIKGKNAVKKLLDIRGSSNPKYASPGTIRGDFAKDQDYIKLKKQKKIALNLFHACDNEEESNLLINYMNF